MIYLTMKNGGGNHGHQLFDLVGTLTIAKVFGFKYVHTYNEYLNFSGIQLNEMKLSELDSDMPRVMVTGNKHLKNCFQNFPSMSNFPKEKHSEIINFDLAKTLLEKRGWGFDDTFRFIDNCPVGVPSYAFAKNIFDPIKEKYKNKDCLIVLDCLRGSSVRILPHQVFEWNENGLISENIFSNIVNELGNKFYSRWSDKTSYFGPDTINVSMHIGRGRDYINKFKKTDTSSCHHQFSNEYWETLILDIQKALHGKKYCIHIYTEKLNSEEIVEMFSNKPNIKFHIGENRGQCDYNKIYDIFYHFVDSDIHVCSNSGFSTAPGFFRKKGVMIYHPHHTFYGLSNAKGFLETSKTGNIKIADLKNILKQNYSKNEPIKKKEVDEFVPSNFNIIEKQDYATLICVNTCKKHLHELDNMKQHELFKHIQQISDKEVKLLSYVSDGDFLQFDNDQITLTNNEKYDKLHTKTYDMIKFCVSNFNFKHIVKLDCNFLTYSSVGERTRNKICGVDRVEKLIFKSRFAQYAGTNGRPFLKRDYYKWMQGRGEAVKLPEPEWMSEDITYYCGKAYKIGYDFASFISKSKQCAEIHNQHDIKDENGFRPFSIEDVMIGRMFKLFEESMDD